MKPEALSQPRSVAVVGSGPAGCYAAQALIKGLPGARVTILEALPAPFGLIRYGVAADHQGTKAVARQFERLFAHPAVRFAGNVRVGCDVAFEDLAENFDAVVLATGLGHDRQLEVPRDGAVEPIGAGALLRALNGHPHPGLPRVPDGSLRPVGEDVAVVGMGNVAIDVLRLLAKAIPALAGSDIDDSSLGALRPERPRRIDAVARGAASRAACDIAMLRELTLLPDADIAVTGLDRDEGGPIVALLAPFSADAQSARATPGRTLIALHFGLVPERLGRRGEKTELWTRSVGGAPVGFRVDSVITAIGFSGPPSPHGAHPTEAWSGEHVYRTGWLSSGGRGAIASHRREARALVDRIAADCALGRVSSGRPGFSAIEPNLPGPTVSFSDWLALDAHERETAAPDRCRRKVTDLEQMLAISTGSSLAPARPGQDARVSQARRASSQPEG